MSKDGKDEKDENEQRDPLLPCLDEEKLGKVNAAKVAQSNPEKFPKEVFRDKWILEAQKSWDIFYKLNTTNFFKDRHWLQREFPTVLSPTGSQRSLLEVGCGVAVGMVKANKLYDTARINAFEADITIPGILTTNLKDISESGVDIVTSIFCLSAIPPLKLGNAFQNIADSLKVGGTLIMRDYAQGDGAQLRFKANNVISLDDSFYVRHDHTFSVFFTPEQIDKECERVGLKVVECGIVEKTVVYRKQALNMSRLFVQGVFIKT